MIYFGETDNDLTVTFTVTGAPQGKARPRVTRNGTYTPAKTKAYEQTVQLAYMMQCQGAMFPLVPLSMLVTAYYPIPKNTSKAKREKMLSGKIRPTVKADWDNIGKAVCDALNGQAYKDDAYIVDGRVTKWYSDNPRIEVMIRTVSNE